MRILFDECVPWPLHKALPATTAALHSRCIWKRIKNGQLLSLAEPHFDLFLTCDQNLRYQQTLTGRSIAVLELSTNKLRPLQAAAELIRENLASMRPTEFRRLEIP